MKIAIVCSNYLSINKHTKNGTRIIVRDFINNLVNQKDIEVVAFASGDSDLPVRIESVSYLSTIEDKAVMRANRHILFELALLSKAFSEQEEFDLYHINLGDGDIALPFARFVKKPLLVTLYHPTDVEYAKKYLNLFKDCKNIFFVVPTNRQREMIPDLPYVATIPHGINTGDFKFYSKGGLSMMWAGRVVPDKGMDIAIDLANRTERSLKLFGTIRKEYEKWFEEKVLPDVKCFKNISLTLGKDRLDLIKDFQTSKLFLFPLQWEEPFGLVLIEAMSCGTPVVAYARGSIPEIIKDGETGFIVNSSDSDIRGDWIVKKTGIEGLIEAVERIYSMPENEYLAMREACRKHIEKNFTIEKMVEEYKRVYKKIVSTKEQNE
ncbi:MAG: glycosyltransferase [Candidatus Levybacteria bacterium]|nr:glycosyltransferase [Candidatus Levybacteria bacterium]